MSRIASVPSPAPATISQRLASLALEVASSERAWLRVPIFTDLLAARGRQFETTPIERALSTASGPGIRVYLGAVRMHARTQDDFLPSGRLHVGAIVIPAVMASGFASDPGGALAAGFAVAIAVSESYGSIAQEKGLRPTGLFGPMAAAVAAAVAMELDEETCATAIGIATTMAGGTTQAWIDGGLEWLTEAGVAARAGVESALLAREGMPAATSAFEGTAGYGAAFFSDAGASRLEDRLTRWAGPARIAVKRYPISGIAQTPATAAAAVGGRLDGRPPDRLVVHMHPDELSYPGTRNRGPFRSRSDSLMSVARCVSLAYRDGRVGYEDLCSAPSESESAVIDVVEFVSDPSIEPGTTRIEGSVGGVSAAAEATADEVLYPSWDAVLADAAGWEQAMEAPEGCAKEAALAVSSGFDVSSLEAAMEGTT